MVYSFHLGNPAISFPEEASQVGFLILGQPIHRQARGASGDLAQWHEHQNPDWRTCRVSQLKTAAA